MTRTLRLAAAAALLLFAASLVWAQPGGGQRRPGGAMGMGAGAILGYLALDPDIGLSNEQLIALRESLRPAYLEQMELREDLQSGAVDFRDLGETMADQRKAVMERIAEVLTEDQQKTMDDRMEEMRSRAGRGRRPGGWN